MKSTLTLLIPFLMLTSCKNLMKKEISEPEKVVIKLFEAYPTDGLRKAIGTLLRSNKYISKQIADTVATKLERLTRGLGSFDGYEKIRERTYGEGITLLTYIVKYSRQPVRFNFKFYQPGNGWTIQNFSYEVEFLDELDESVNPTGSGRTWRMTETYAARVCAFLSVIIPSNKWFFGTGNPCLAKD